MTTRAVTPFQTIVVGADGSSGSIAAVEWSARVAAACGAEVVAICAYDWNPMVGDSVNQEVSHEMRDALNGDWVEPLRRHDVRHRAVFEVGDSRVVLLAAADVYDADILVVGSRGRSQLSEVLLGSVAHYLTHQSRRPVVVIPHHAHPTETRT